MEMTNFDRATRWHYPKIACNANGSAIRLLNNREKQWIILLTHCLKPLIIALKGTKGAIRKIGPATPIFVQHVRSIELFSMALWSKRLQTAEAAIHWLRRRVRGLYPLSKRLPDRLAEIIHKLRHILPFTSNRDRETPHDAPPPTSPGIRITYHGDSVT